MRAIGCKARATETLAMGGLKQVRCLCGIASRLGNRTGLRPQSKKDDISGPIKTVVATGQHVGD